MLYGSMENLEFEGLVIAGGRGPQVVLALREMGGIEVDKTLLLSGWMIKDTLDMVAPEV